MTYYVADGLADESNAGSADNERDVHVVGHTDAADNDLDGYIAVGHAAAAENDFDGHIAVGYNGADNDPAVHIAVHTAAQPTAPDHLGTGFHCHRHNRL